MTRIIQATPAQTDSIRSIAEKTYWSTYRDILSADQIRYMLRTIYAGDNIRSQLETKSQMYLLLFEDDESVAFASYAPKAETPPVYKLHKLYCLPKAQGKGYGKLLIEEVAKKVLEAGKEILDLNVNRYNKAKRFYEKMGFEVVYEEDIPIGDYWMNDYVMRKKLI